MASSRIQEQSPPASGPHARANAPYSYRAPSPPLINIPPILAGDSRFLRLIPSYANIDSAYLTAQDLEAIAAGSDVSPQPQRNPNASPSLEWSYEKRRQAQPIVDFLYLGPSTIARDKTWMQKEGITMVMVARDETQAIRRLLTVDRACDELGIAVAYVDISTKWELVSRFPHVIRKINDHLIAIHQTQAANDDSTTLPEDMIAVPSSVPRKMGKVLVVCESGNDRSPPVVAAYVMAVFGLSVGEAVRFVTLRRFSCCFDETMKQILQSWEDILQARRCVNQARQEEEITPRNGKRNISETMDDDEGGDSPNPFALDMDRYENRQAFVPFADIDMNA